jgi:hypothetical protein
LSAPGDIEQTQKIHLTSLFLVLAIRELQTSAAEMAVLQLQYYFSRGRTGYACHFPASWTPLMQVNLDRFWPQPSKGSVTIHIGWGKPTSFRHQRHFQISPELNRTSALTISHIGCRR